MKLKIKQEHINKGSPRLSDSCPIALALKDRGYIHVYVGNKFVFVNTKSGQLRYDLGKDAYQFVRNFDYGRKVEPQTIELTGRKVAPCLIMEF